MRHTHQLVLRGIAACFNNYIWWPKYANVGLDLVRSSGRLFPKFGRNTLIFYATRLEKIKAGSSFNVQQNAEHWFFVFWEWHCVIIVLIRFKPRQQPAKTEKNLLCGIWKWYHVWCDFALLFLQTPGIFDYSRLRRLLHSQYSTYKYKENTLV